jgi:hypothetical protein
MRTSEGLEVCNGHHLKYLCMYTVSLSVYVVIHMCIEQIFQRVQLTHLKSEQEMARLQTCACMAFLILGLIKRHDNLCERSK